MKQSFSFFSSVFFLQGDGDVATDGGSDGDDVDTPSLHLPHDCGYDDYDRDDDGDGDGDGDDDDCAHCTLHSLCCEMIKAVL